MFIFSNNFCKEKVENDSLYSKVYQFYTAIYEKTRSQISN